MMRASGGLTCCLCAAPSARCWTPPPPLRGLEPGEWPCAPTPSSGWTPTSPFAEALYYINVGLFSKPENASHVHAQLLEANLPSVMKELKTTKERQIRVRVGPYDTEAKAEAAAQKIKAMQFEAGVIQK